MKAKKTIALVMVMAIVCALPFTASAAIGSPSGSSIGGYSDNVSSIQVYSLSTTQETALTSAAQSYINSNLGGGTAEPLLAMDLVITRTDDKPVTITLNVAGARRGDRIIVVHQLENGSYEFVNGTVTADGVVRFTLRNFSPISIIRVNGGRSSTGSSSSGTPTMYKTGDSTPAVSMALLAMLCGAVIVVCARALRRTH